MEVWKPVTGYEGYYEVSNAGRVRSVSRDITKSNGVMQPRKGKLMTQHKTNDGYMTVKLSRGGESHRTFVHRLVSIEFVDGMEPGYEVNHKDYDRANNNATNLEWVTHEDNIQYTIRGNRHVSQTHDFSGAHNPNYGNRKLSQIYAANKNLAIQKQGRPGAQNGRSRAVTIIDADNTAHNFDYIGQCAEWMIAHKICRSRDKNSVAILITKAAQTGKPYFGYRILMQ